MADVTMSNGVYTFALCCLCELRIDWAYVNKAVSRTYISISAFQSKAGHVGRMRLVRCTELSISSASLKITAVQLEAVRGEFA